VEPVSRVSEAGTRAARVADLLEKVNERIGQAVSWLTLGMVLVTFLIVVLRYVFDLGWIAMQESVTYMHAIVFLCGLGYTLNKGRHVRVDIFFDRWSERTRRWVDFFGTLLLLFPVCGFIAWVSWDYVLQSWQIGEGSREAGGLPGVFLLKSLILLASGLLVLQGVVVVIRTLAGDSRMPGRSGREYVDNGHGDG